MTSIITTPVSSTASVSSLISAPQANSVPEQKSQNSAPAPQQPQQDVFVKESKNINGLGIIASIVGAAALIFAFVSNKKAGELKEVVADLSSKVEKFGEQLKNKLAPEAEAAAAETEKVGEKIANNTEKIGEAATVKPTEEIKVDAPIEENPNLSEGEKPKES